MPTSAVSTVAAGPAVSMVLVRAPAVLWAVSTVAVGPAVSMVSEITAVVSAPLAVSAPRERVSVSPGLPAPAPAGARVLGSVDNETMLIAAHL
jgi:hypothetical protein